MKFPVLWPLSFVSVWVGLAGPHLNSRQNFHLLKQINNKPTNAWVFVILILGIFFLSFAFSIFVAFILEAFMLEYSITHGKIETVFSKKIEETGIGVGM